MKLGVPLRSIFGTWRKKKYFFCFWFGILTKRSSNIFAVYCSWISQHFVKVGDKSSKLWPEIRVNFTFKRFCEIWRWWDKKYFLVFHNNYTTRGSIMILFKIRPFAHTTHPNKKFLQSGISFWRWISYLVIIFIVIPKNASS